MNKPRLTMKEYEYLMEQERNYIRMMAYLANMSKGPINGHLYAKRVIELMTRYNNMLHFRTTQTNRLLENRND